MESKDFPYRRFRILALIGALWGGWGAIYALAASTPMLKSHDQFVSAVSEVARNQAAALPDATVRSAVEQILQKRAEIHYAQRGATLAASVAHFILRLLLFWSCLRALGRDPWGWDAWRFVALISLPLLFFEGFLGFMQYRELKAQLGSAFPSGVPVLVNGWLDLERTLIWGHLVVGTMFFLTCWSFLSLPQVKDWFIARKGNEAA